jgi:transcriptional regulator with XRE-family HTH domain
LTNEKKKGFEKRFPARDSVAARALAANVRRLRKERGWSQDRLAVEVGIEQNAISLIENGRSNLTLLLAEEIALSLGTQLHALLEPPTRTRRNDR